MEGVLLCKFMHKKMKERHLGMQMLHIYGRESLAEGPVVVGGWSTCGNRELGLFSCRKRRLRETVLLSSAIY